MNRKKISRILCLIIATILSSGIAYPEDRKGSAVEGRVVGRDGTPVAGVRVIAVLPDGEEMDGYDLLEARTKSNGKFVIKGLHPGSYYRVFVDGGQCNRPKERIRSMPPGETARLEKDLVLSVSLFKVSSDGVIRDLLTGLEWAPVSVSEFTYYDHAESFAASRVFIGGGWRLPTVDEVRDLYETAQRGCGLDEDAFKARFPRVWASDPKSHMKEWIVTFSRDTLSTNSWYPEYGPCDNCRVLTVRSPGGKPAARQDSGVVKNGSFH